MLSANVTLEVFAGPDMRAYRKEVQLPIVPRVDDLVSTGDDNFRIQEVQMFDGSNQIVLHCGCAEDFGMNEDDVQNCGFTMFDKGFAAATERE